MRVVDFLNMTANTECKFKKRRTLQTHLPPLQSGRHYPEPCPGGVSILTSVIVNKGIGKTLQIGTFAKRNWTPTSILIVSKLVSSYDKKIYFM